MRNPICFAVLASLLSLVPCAQAQQASQQENLRTCLTGKFRALCRYDLLTPEERAQVRTAELRENLAVCLTGRFRALCNYAELTAEQVVSVRRAEEAENRSTCLSGKYPVLCRYDLLSPQELDRTRAAEKAENLRVCLDGRYPVLCQRGLLTPEQAGQAAAAEAKVPAASPAPVTSSNESSCRESSIVSPTPFMGNNGEVFKLADGSYWEVKYEYEYMYEYYPEVVICPLRGKLHVRGKSLDVQQITSSRATPPTAGIPERGTITPDVIESRIDGEFTGWEGETIFKLQNGQMWQQSSYAYKYKYAYSPKVLIYKSGAVYKMRVDGMDGDIAVQRIK